MPSESLFWLVASVVALLGILGLFCCRQGGVGTSRWYSVGFFGSFALVAAATILALLVRNDNWIVSGTMLAAMVVGGIWDTDR
jgi:hypothetical protein